ncbi:MAG: hypothetical protein ACI9FU_001382 [Granulosicoccus sp.]|jgi:hypothetical protein
MVYVRFFLDKKEPNQPAGWQEIKKERKKEAILALIHARPPFFQATRVLNKTQNSRVWI